MEIEIAAELPLLEPLPLGVKTEADLAAAAPQAAPPAGPLDDLQALLAGDAPSWLAASKEAGEQLAGQQQQQQQAQQAQQQAQQAQQPGAADAEMADAEADGAVAPAEDGQPASEAAAAAPSEGGTAAGAPSDAAAPDAAEDGPPGEDDALAADLLSNMAAWQSELDTFTAALKRCMETQAKPNEGAGRASPSVDGSGLGSARLQHSGPKGVTGFRGVTQHKRTKRYEANVWMDHKQMYLGAFDAPEQAAHAHDIGALCSGKARPDSLNFPLSDYEPLLPLLSSLPHAQIVAALRSYGRLPTARPAGGVSSGRLLASPATRSGSGRSGRGKGGGLGAASDTEEDEEGMPVERAPRPRRQRKLSSKSLGDSPVPSRLGAASPIDWQAALAARDDLGSTAAVPGLPPPASVAAAQQAQLQALSAALLGGPRAPSALSGAAGEAKEEPQEQAGPAALGGGGKPPGLPLAAPPASQATNPLLLGSMGGLPPLPALPSLPMPPGAMAALVSPLGAFETALGKVMARSHELERPEGEGTAPRPLHSGPKGQSGFKGVTLYKRCQRYNAHIWLGKQTHIGTFHTAEQAAVAHDVMELWRNESAQGLNFASTAYTDLLPLLKSLSEADALSALRTYSRSPAAAAAAAVSGAATGRAPGRPNTPASRPSAGPSGLQGRAAAREPREPREAPVQPPAPSLRRRSRKPQHVAAADKSEDSSGSVPPPPAVNTRTSAGSLMWYMLEQEKSNDDDFSGEQEDPDFSPADDIAAQQTSRARRGGSESPSYEPLGFHPRVTPSVAAALVADIPFDQAIVGARPPRPGSSHRWGVAVSLRGQAAWFGRLDRQRAAVAADLSLAWRRLTNAAETGEPLEERDAAIYNVPSANYDQDSALTDQLRRIRTAPGLCQFLTAVIPQDPPAAPGTAAAAAAASSLPASRLAAANNPLAAAAALAAAAVDDEPAGARKRKLQSLIEETQAAKLARMASTNSGSASPRPPLPPAPTAAPASALLSCSSTPADITPAAPLALPVAASGTGPHLVGPAQQQQQQQQQQQPSDGLLSAAAAAMAAADSSSSTSMLSALRVLADAGQGGNLLKDVLASWGDYSEAVQQDVFTALQMPVAGGDWEQLEGRLQVALDLASLF